MTLGCLILSAGTAAAADGKKAEFLIKLGHCDSDISIVDSPYMAYTQTFKTIVESRTDGRIAVQVFPNSQLGDLRSQVEQTARGEIQMTAGLTADLLSSYDPNIQVLAIPYTFRTTEIGRLVMDGPFGDEMGKLVTEKSKLKVLSWLPTAFRNFSNNVREIKNARRYEGPQDENRSGSHPSGNGEGTWSESHPHSLGRTLFGPANGCRRRTGKSALLHHSWPSCRKSRNSTPSTIIF